MLWGDAFAQTIPAAPAAAAPIQDASWGTVAAWAAIGVTLLWNLGNSIWTYRTARHGRRADFEFDEFTTTFRQPLQAALDELEKVALDTRAVWRSNSRPLAKHRRTIKLFQSDYPEALQKVQRVLEHMDDSTSVQGQDWLAEMDNRGPAMDAQMHIISNNLVAEPQRQAATEQLVAVVTEAKMHLIHRAATEARRCAGL